jgi:hypothetical protein
MELHYLPPVSPASFKSLEDLKQNIFTIMKDYYVENRERR